MRLISIATCLSAGALAFAAHAQVSDTTPGGDPSLNQPPPTTDQAPPPAPAPGAAPSDQTAPPAPPSAYSASATPPGGATIQMQPQQPVVQAAPQSTGDYPRCTRTVRDSCTNPGAH